MSNAAQVATGMVILLGIFFVESLGLTKVTHGRRWAWREVRPALLGFWVPAVALMEVAIVSYLAVPSAPVPRAAVIVASVGAEAGLLFLNVRSRRRGRERSAVAESFRLRVRQGFARASPGRRVALILVCLWAAAGIIGGLLTFVKHRASACSGQAICERISVGRWIICSIWRAGR